MANVNSVSNSYSSSLYGTRNVLSGLASGLDTESMIENSVSGYKQKITQLQQQMESLTWKQDAYRGLTDKMLALLDKFTSYTSKTNLASSSYFNQAVKNIISGTYASKISATGRSSSDVQIKSVTSLATAAKYAVGADRLFSGAVSASGGEINWDEKVDVSAIAGSSMTIDVQGAPLKLKFGEDDVYTSLEEMVNGINTKLEATGTTVRAGIGEDGSIRFTAGEMDYSITEVTGPLAGIAERNGEDGPYTINRNAENGLSTKQNMVDYLSGKTIDVTYNGVTKSISLKNLATNVGNGDGDTKTLAKTIQDEVDKAFGAGRINVNVNKDGGLSFDDNGTNSTLKVTSNVKELGIGKGLSNYLDTNKTLSELLGGEWDPSKKFVINDVEIDGIDGNTTLATVMSKINSSNAGVTVSFSSLTNQFVFTTTGTGAGQRIEFGEGLAKDLFSADNSPKSLTLGELFGDSITWDADGKASLTLYTNGTEEHTRVISKNDTMEVLMTSSSSGILGSAGGAIKYDPDTGKYSVKDRDGIEWSEEKLKGTVLQGADGKSVTLKDMIASANTDHHFTAGKDAELTAIINGQEITMKRATNTVDIEGLSVTLKGTFETKGNDEVVSIKTATDTDNIVNDIKSFVDAYNEIMKELHTAFSTQPLTKSSGEKYSPLTDDDKSGMSESAINNYEEKAKTGLLFGDNDLSSLYYKMQGLFTSTMSEFGITAAYSQSDGLTQISLDEDKLRDALEKDPDKVRDAFTSSTALGGGSDGLMTKVKNLFDAYASKSIGSPGILVRKAGTKLSSYSLTHNEVQDQIDKIQEKIDSWQAKLNKKIDYYTRQFTALEKLMNTMNNQSSMLMGLMGGY